MSWRVINRRLRGSRKKKSKLFCFWSGEYFDSAWIVVCFVLDLQIVMQFLCADLHPFPSFFFLCSLYCTVKPLCAVVTGSIASFTPSFTRSAVQNVFFERKRKKNSKPLSFALKHLQDVSVWYYAKLSKEEVVKLNCKILWKKKKEEKKKSLCLRGISLCFLSKVQQLVTRKKRQNRRFLGVKRHCDVISMFGTLKSLYFIFTSLVRNMQDKVPRSSCIAFIDFCSIVLKFSLFTDTEKLSHFFVLKLLTRKHL